MDLPSMRRRRLIEMPGRSCGASACNDPRPTRSALPQSSCDAGQAAGGGCRGRECSKAMGPACAGEPCEHLACHVARVAQGIMPHVARAIKLYRRSPEDPQRYAGRRGRQPVRMRSKAIQRPARVGFRLACGPGSSVGAHLRPCVRCARAMRPLPPRSGCDNASCRMRSPCAQARLQRRELPRRRLANQQSQEAPPRHG